MNYKKGIICFGLCMLLCFAGYNVVDAHPPQGIELSYDYESQILSVTITHNTIDENSHYIYKVEVEKNGDTAISDNYDSQPTRDIFTYFYDIEADTGDELDVTAFCSLFGDLTESLTVTGDNTPPTTPVLTGPANGEAGSSYIYTAVSTDPDGDTLFYCFNWDDGTEFCTDVVESGEQVEASHTWEAQGSYAITVTATDENGISSEPATLQVTMPYIHTPLIDFIENLIEWIITKVFYLY